MLLLATPAEDASLPIAPAASQPAALAQPDESRWSPLGGTLIGPHQGLFFALGIGEDLLYLSFATAQARYVVGLGSAAELSLGAEGGFFSLTPIIAAIRFQLAETSGFSLALGVSGRQETWPATTTGVELSLAASFRMSSHWTFDPALLLSGAYVENGQTLSICITSNCADPHFSSEGTLTVGARLGFSYFKGGSGFVIALDGHAPFDSGRDIVTLPEVMLTLGVPIRW